MFDPTVCGWYSWVRRSGGSFSPFRTVCDNLFARSSRSGCHASQHTWTLVVPNSLQDAVSNILTRGLCRSILLWLPWVAAVGTRGMPRALQLSQEGELISGWQVRNRKIVVYLPPPRCMDA